MLLAIPTDVREAADILASFIATEQRKHPDDSFEYKILNDYYDTAQTFTEKEVEL